MKKMAGAMSGVMESGAGGEKEADPMAAMAKMMPAMLDGMCALASVQKCMESNDRCPAAMLNMLSGGSGQEGKQDGPGPDMTAMVSDCNCNICPVSEAFTGIMDALLNPNATEEKQAMATMCPMLELDACHAAANARKSNSCPKETSGLNMMGGMM